VIFQPGERQGVPTMDSGQLLAVIATGTNVVQRIQRERAQLVPAALLQGAAPVDVAHALGNWTRTEFCFAVSRWAYTLRRQGLIAPAELNSLLAIDATGLPEDPVRTRRRG